MEILFYFLTSWNILNSIGLLSFFIISAKNAKKNFGTYVSCNVSSHGSSRITTLLVLDEPTEVMVLEIILRSGGGEKDINEELLLISS